MCQRRSLIKDNDVVLRRVPAARRETVRRCQEAVPIDVGGALEVLIQSIKTRVGSGVPLSHSDAQEAVPRKDRGKRGVLYGRAFYAGALT